ncbi:papain-like cysteine protease family protein [Neomegalonema perideroedes]|uniref:papain-like cysteine protease family protein n=1 Tax=Neomegalonema perideroedes TaxID=217219 RepID=UPI00037A66E1|nr:papain-like cysteine protease family protein [Neomegalonema perideroedes]
MRIGIWAAAAAFAALAVSFAPGPGAPPGSGLLAGLSGAAQAQGFAQSGTIHPLPDGQRMLVTPDGRRYLLPPAAQAQPGGWPPAPTPVTVAPPAYQAPLYQPPVYQQPTYQQPAPAPAPRPAYAAPAPTQNFSPIPGQTGVSGQTGVAGRGPYTTSTHVSRRESDQAIGYRAGDPRMYVHTQDGRTPVPPTIELNIAPSIQEESLWCWAAAAQQAVGWANRGRAPAQCEIVAMVHGLDAAACCADPKGVCNVTGEIPEIIQLVRRFGGQAANAPVPKTPKDIQDVVAQNKTLLIRLRPQPREEAVGIRHMIVVRGVEWFRMPNGRIQAKLLYNDPLGEGQRAVNFDEIVGFFEQAMVVSP